MTLPKKPLPSLRFVLHVSRTEKLELIPQTTTKGKIVKDHWCAPGCKIYTTADLVAFAKAQRWKHEITGNDGTRRGRRI